MKIVKISAQNINSLKGKTEIDFEKAFGDSSLFAITGPTGAGKSTILDIISCALYGRTARLANPSELMSKNAGEAMCEAEFEVKGKRYRVSWFQKRARGRYDGNLQPAKMELYSFEEEKIIAAGVRDVPKEVEMLCGLDFTRFTQSMMLAQGSFDAFLKAKEADRSLLLEKITGTKIYADISKAVYRRHEELEQKVALAQERLGVMTLLESEILHTKKKRLDNIALEKNSLKERIGKLSKEIAWIETKVRLEKELTEAAEAFGKISSEKEHHREDFVQLETAQRARTVAPFYRRKTEIDKRLTETEQELVKLEAEQKNVTQMKSERKKEQVSLQERFSREEALYTKQQKKLKEVRVLLTRERALLEQKKGDENALQKLSEEYEAVNERVRLITGRLEHIREKISIEKKYLFSHKADAALVEELGMISEEIKRVAQLHEEIAEVEKERKTTEEALQKDSLTFESLKERFEEQHERLKKLEKDLSDHQTRLFGLQEREPQMRKMVQTYSLLLDKFTAYENLKQELEKGTLRIERYRERLEALAKERKYLQNELHLTREKLQFLKEREQQNLLLQKYEEDRKKLKEGEACFLCGATHHPYVHERVEILPRDTIEKELEEVEKTLIDLDNRRVEAENAYAKGESLLEQEEAQLQKNRKERDILEALFAKEGMNLSSLTRNELEKMLERADEEIKNFEKITKDRELMLQKRDNLAAEVRKTETEYNALETTIRLHKSKREHLDKLYTQHRSARQKMVAELSKKVQKYGLTLEREEGAEIYTVLEKRHRLFVEHQATLQELEKREQETVVEMEKSKTEAQRLHEQIVTYEQTIQKQSEALIQLRRERLALLNVEDIDLYEKEITQAFEKSRNMLQQCSDALLSLEVEEDALHKQIGALHDMAEKYQQEREQLTEAFGAALVKEDFKNEEDFLSALLEEEVFAILQKRCRELELAYEKARTLRDERDKQLKRHLCVKEKSIKPLEELFSEKREAESALETLQMEEGKIQEELDQDARNRKVHQEGVAALEMMQKELVISGKLKDLIGSAEGTKFSKFAQGITLDQLIALANRHLRILNKRYFLQRAQTEKQLLEMEIVDTYQGNITRSVNTLSGGESFIVSLSLALGLSELASQKIKIDSLFLDEGFGTLDEESLEMALNALSILQDSGKMIGVISHVEALKERITQQINIVPRGDGTSSVEICA